MEPNFDNLTQAIVTAPRKSRRPAFVFAAVAVVSVAIGIAIVFDHAAVGSEKDSGAKQPSSLIVDLYPHDV